MSHASARAPRTAATVTDAARAIDAARLLPVDEQAQVLSEIQRLLTVAFVRLALGGHGAG